jgi:catechol 2,3-dioxygenase-like lactoylglutathione lyase family enzyme
MEVLRLDHVQLAMPAGREDEARRFYRDLLGIPEREKPPALAARGDEPLAGYLRVYVDDPFGNRLEFMEPTLE